MFSGFNLSLEPLLIKDGDLLLRYKYMDSLQERYFCIVTLTVSAQTVFEVNMTDSQMAELKHPTCTLRIRADPMEAL